MNIINFDFKENEHKFIKACNRPEIKKLFNKCIKSYLRETGTTDRPYHRNKPPCMYSTYIMDFYNDIYYNLDEEKRVTPHIYNEMLKHYKGYIIYGGCHFINPIVMLKVAQILIPDEIWRIRTNNHTHTTIINKHNNKIFDPITYAEETDED